MREIKFRGRSIRTGEWVVGYLFPCSLLEDPDYLSPLWIATGFENECLPVDKETVGQFTGLHDKNGKEIYEGDVVRDGFGQVNEIKYVAGSFWFNWLEMPQGIDQVENGEIIGNIHENPELLNDL